MGPEKSAAMVFGPVRSRPSCSVFLSGQLLPVVSSHRYLGVVLTSSLRWDAHLAPISSLAVTGSSRKVLRGSTPKASLHLLHISCSPRTYNPVPPLVPTREVSRSWTLHNNDGDVISLDGHRARRPLRYFMNLRCPTVSACLLVELWLCSADSTRSPQQLACHSPPQSSLSHCAHQAHGPIGVCLFSNTMQQRLWTVRVVL